MPAEKQVIRVNSLSGGVARQAPSKRMPTEVEEADNVLLTLERSAEKRQPSVLIPGEGANSTLNIADDSDDLLYYYYDLDGTNQQIIVVNPDAVSLADVVQIFEAKTGNREAAPSLVQSLNNNPAFRTYLQVGGGDKTSKQRLRFIEVDGNLLILNTEVEATFLTDGEGAAITYLDPVTGLKVRDLDQEVDPYGVLQDVGLNRLNYSQFRLPPDPSDPAKGNGAESVVGLGLVWYARENYQDFPGQGFYKAVGSNEQPWYVQTRTEQAGSLLDGDTWPWLIEYDSANDDFAVGQPKWAPRLSGLRSNNPGPSPLVNSKDPFNSTNPTGAKLSAGVYFRNRLWFASGDTLFSSQFNDPYNMWIADPIDLLDTDPIDVQASAGNNSTISWLVSYRNFMFVTTTGDTQFELRGQTNFISPRTAALEPTSFYGTSRFTSPMKVGSLLFFTDNGRLFMYQGTNTESIQHAINISQQAFGYFPHEVSCSFSAPNQDTLGFVDQNNENHMYLYTARFNGEQQAQNAFYRWTSSEESRMKYAYVIDNYLHVLIRRPSQVDINGNIIDYGTYLERIYLERTLPSDVLLDRRIESTGINNGSDTLFPIPYIPSPSAMSEVDENGYSTGFTCWYNHEGLQGVVEKSNGQYWFRALNVSLGGQTADLGENYLMNLALSSPIMRDQYNNFLDGRTVLKDMNIRHYQTGRYDVLFYRWDRDPTKVSFDPMRTNNPFSPLGTGNYFDLEGNFSPKVQAWDSKSQIKIQSDYPVPVNITNLEYRVDFSPALSSSVTQ